MIEQTMSMYVTKDHLISGLRLDLKRAESLLKEFVRGACSTAVSDEDWEALVDETVKFLESREPA